MADTEVKWAPIYVIGAGYKKVNGAWTGSGNYEGELRYKAPSAPIWCFICPERGAWIMCNKSRYLEDAKIMYKNKHNMDSGGIPQKGWKKLSAPGAMPNPKVINSAYVEGEEVECFSTKKKKWLDGVIRKANEKGNYKVTLAGVRKPINIAREQIRMKAHPDHGDPPFTDKQFVEVKNKSGDWMSAMIGEVKGGGKYYIVLPDGKGATFPEGRIRPSALCRVDDEPAQSSSKRQPPAGGAKEQTQPPAQKSQGGDDKDAIIAEKDRIIADLRARVAALEAGAGASTGGDGANDGIHLNDDFVLLMKQKQAELQRIVTEIQTIQDTLFQ